MLNFLFKIIVLCRKAYWFTFRPITVGVKILAFSDNKVLLVKNRYDKFWYLPGGGVKSGETCSKAAEREMKEECGIIPNNLRIIGVYSSFVEHKSDHIILLSCDMSELAPKKGFEIDRMALFEMNNLPEKTSPATKRRIEDFISGKNKIASDKW